MKKVLLLVLYLVAQSLSASEINYDLAIKYAKLSEGKLSQSDMSVLVKKQAELASAAFPYCMNSTQSAPGNFTVVVKLNLDGKAQYSWVNKSARFAECFREMMASRFSYKPPFVPFYMAFEYTNK